MNVKRLREMIEGLPDDMEVIMQKDADGDDYSPLYDVDGDCIYVPYNTWSGHVYSPDWSADDACMDNHEWEELKSKSRVVVLTPTN